MSHDVSFGYSLTEWGRVVKETKEVVEQGQLEQK